MKKAGSLLRYLWHHKILTGIGIGILICAFIFWPRPAKPIATQKVVASSFIQSVSVSGTIIAKNSVNMTFPTSGKLTWVGVKKGDYVWAGQTIATIDTRTVEKNLQIALTNYSLQRNAFDQLQSDNQNRTPQEALNDDMKRILQNNQYDLDKAVFSVELQDLARQMAILVAPINGVITRADTEIAGPDALAGSTTYTITDPATIAFAIDVDQADISKIQKGQVVHIILDAYPNKTLTAEVGKIDFVSHTTTNGGNAFTVEVLLPDNSDYAYRVGMNGNAEIILSQKDNVVSVPLSSLVNDHYVFVKNAKGFSKKNITIGQENDTDAEVVKGLSVGENVALDPVLAEKQAAK